MYINTVDSLKDSFTPFKRVVWAYVGTSKGMGVYRNRGNI